MLDLATARYEGGVATYLDVITAQQALLNNGGAPAAQLQGQRLLTSVFLIKALGGDWQGIRQSGRRSGAIVEPAIDTGIPPVLQSPEVFGDEEGTVALAYLIRNFATLIRARSPRS